MDENTPKIGYNKAGVGIGLAAFAVLFAYTFVYAFRVPFADHWDEIRFLIQHEAGNTDWFFAIHGGHWHSTGYAVNMALTALTGFNPVNESLASVVLGGLACIVMMPTAARMAPTGRRPVIASGLAAILLLSLDQASNWLWGWQTAVFVNILGCVSFTVLACSDRFGWLQFFGMMMSALVAIFAFATALALPFIGLLVIAFRVWGPTKREPASVLHFLAWAIFTMCISALYWTSLTQVSALAGITSGDLAPGGILELVSYLAQFVLAYIGAAISGGTDTAAFVAMLIGSICLIYAVRRSIQRGDTIDDILPSLILMAIALGAAGFTALGRSDYGHMQALVSRYLSFSSLFWLGAGLWFLRVLPPLSALKSKPSSGLIMFTVCLAILCLAKTENIVRAAGNGMELSNQLSESAQTLKAEYPDISTELIYSLGQVGGPKSHERIRRDIQYLHDNGLPPFQTRDAKTANQGEP